MCDGGSELGGGKVVVQTLPRGDSHSAVPSAHQGQQKVTVKVSGKCCAWQVWSCIRAHLALVLNIYWPDSRLAVCYSFQTKHSAPFLKTRFWLLSSAMLCLVIITLYFPTYGSTLQMNVGFWSPLPRASLRNAGRKVMIALLCQTLGRSIIKSYFNGTDIKKLIDESYT